MYKCVFFYEKGRPECGANAAPKNSIKSTGLRIVCFSLALVFISFRQFSMRNISFRQFCAVICWASTQALSQALICACRADLRGLCSSCRVTRHCKQQMLPAGCAKVLPVGQIPVCTQNLWWLLGFHCGFAWLALNAPVICYPCRFITDHDVHVQAI